MGGVGVGLGSLRSSTSTSSNSPNFVAPSSSPGEALRTPLKGLLKHAKSGISSVTDAMSLS